jgi:hypothetical protein
MLIDILDNRHHTTTFLKLPLSQPYILSLIAKIFISLSPTQDNPAKIAIDEGVSRHCRPAALKALVCQRDEIVF